MSVREKRCGLPRADGCGKKIGKKPYAVRHDANLNQSIVYHLECAQKLPTMEFWTTLPDAVIAMKIAEDLITEAIADLVEKAWNKASVAIKSKHKDLLNKYPNVKDNDIKKMAKHRLRRRRG